VSVARKRRGKTQPTIYLDANVISAMFYRGRSIFGLAQRATTLDWWESEREQFIAYSSGVTEQELAQGAYSGQKEAVRFVRRLSHLPVTKAVSRCASELIGDGIVPSTKPGDALHLALAIIHRIDYLISWNHAHLVNVAVAEQLGRFAARHSYRPPLLVSPNTIPQVKYGQRIRRAADG
jgi:predicted nucleic acid-binding protein